MDLPTAHALVRFGLGRRVSDPLPSDPHAWLQLQLVGPDKAAITPPASSALGLEVARVERMMRRQEATAVGAATPENPMMPTVMTPNGTAAGGENPGRALYQAQAAAELAHAVTTQQPYRERLVWFWTNHFTVSLKRAEITPLAAAFVEEAIRPHVTGRFEDMVLAVMRHPAMLLYLDNAGSVGPQSLAGLRSHRGLNENLARECMELHTVTPLAGYSQADVTAFAKLLTGWSVEREKPPLGFRYRPQAHEPGMQVVMGQRFAADEDGGVAALRFLANHPATHRVLATKLVAYFVADTPPPDAVRRIEGVLRDTRGNLGAAASELIHLDAAWQPGTKVRTPTDLVVAAVRALDIPPDTVPMVGILGGLGQPPWTAPAPNGWPDRAADWASPEAMIRRIDWANGYAGRIGDRDVLDLATATLGPLLRPATVDAMRHAGSRRDAFALFLSSPEFQRR